MVRTETQDGAAGSEFGKKQKEEQHGGRSMVLLRRSSRWRTSPGSLKLTARQKKVQVSAFILFVLLTHCLVLHFSELAAHAYS